MEPRTRGALTGIVGRPILVGMAFPRIALTAVLCTTMAGGLLAFSPSEAMAAPSDYSTPPVIVHAGQGTDSFELAVPDPTGGIWTFGDALTHYSSAGVADTSISGADPLSADGYRAALAAEADGGVVAAYWRDNFVDIARHDAAGALVAQFSVAGQANAIASAPDGSIWVYGSLNTLTHVSPVGAVLGSFRLPDTLDGTAVLSFEALPGVAVLPNGDLLIRLQGRLLEYTPSGTFVGQWGLSDGAGGILGSGQVDVLAGQVWVHVTGGLVVRLADAGDRSGSGAVSPSTAYGSVHALDVDAHRMVGGFFVFGLDRDDHGVIVASNDSGTAQAAWAGPDAAPSTIHAVGRDNLSATATSSGRTFILDRFNDRVLIESPGGHYLGQWDVAADADVVSAHGGRVYVESAGRIAAFTSAGVALWTYDLPARRTALIRSHHDSWSMDRTIAVDDKDRVTVLAKHVGTNRLDVIRISHRGRLMSTWTTTGGVGRVLAVDPRGRPTIVSSHGITAYSVDGRPRFHAKLDRPGRIGVRTFSVADAAYDPHGRLYVEQAAGVETLGVVVDRFSASLTPQKRFTQKRPTDFTSLGFYTGARYVAQPMSIEDQSNGHELLAAKIWRR